MKLMAVKVLPRARAILSQRLFEIVDGGNLRGPEAGGAQGWQRSQSSAEGGCRFCGQRRALQISWCPATLWDQSGQCLGPMKAEHRAAARLGVEAVRESSFHAGALIQKWQWPDMGG